MSSNAFDEWLKTTPFSDDTFFSEYIEYLISLDLSSGPIHTIDYSVLKKARTTPIMSRLNHTTSNPNACIDALILDYYWFRMVVIHKVPEKYGSIVRTPESWTMTELKKASSSIFEQMDKERAVRTIRWDDTNELNVWAAPLHLRAVTAGDKDFRKEYEWGNLVYEGNQYGDTSDFYIIGSLQKKL